MNDRDAYSEELLSAYLDGEVTDEERRHVEQGLAHSARYRRRLDSLRRLSDGLQGLSRHRLSLQASSRILAAIGERTIPGEAPEAFDELIGGYLDGELSIEDRGLVEERLKRDPAAQRQLNKLRRLQEQIAQLPAYRLDQSFADRVLGQLGDPRREAVATVAAPTTRARWRGRRWPAAAAVLAIAAALMLMFVVNRLDDPGGAQLAEPGRLNSRELVVSPPVDPEHIDQPDENFDLSPMPTDPQWTLISSIGRRAGSKMILVYEVTVNQQGVERAAFANLLRRHQIGFDSTQPIAREDQADLLRHRFLDDVRAIPEGGPDMDPVQLYLVTTTGANADAIYHDLMRRPLGFDSFFLNLTTGDAHQRVLNRLCEASGVREQRGQAVQLLANLGIFSGVARNVGTFGAIRWVDPKLLEGQPTPADEPDSDVADEDDETGMAAEQRQIVQGDFTCQVLFVVREARGG